MQLGKATLLEVNDERNVNKNVWQFVLCYFGRSRENPEMARLQIRFEESEKLRSDTEKNLRESSSEKQILRKQLGIKTAQTRWLTFAVVIYILFYHSVPAFVFGLVVIAVVHGNYLLQLLENPNVRATDALRVVAGFWQFASERLGKARLAVLLCAQQMLVRIRDRKWKSIFAFRAARPTP